MSSIPNPDFKAKQMYILNNILKLRFNHFTQQQEEDIKRVCEEANIIDAFARMDYYTAMNKRRAIESLNSKLPEHI